ncbi:MAG: helix-turn-helix domain-containing protein [Candidatus Limnocylindrus sp.]
MTFADYIRASREALGMTQAQLAAALGISQSTLEKWESGIRRPRPISRWAVEARLAELKTISKP